MKKQQKVTYEVEYDFRDSAYGRRPEYLRIFETREEAEAFAATTTDGRILEATLIEF